MKIIKKKYAWKYTPTARKASTIKYLILHHAAASSCTPDKVHEWHLANGWAGIGYNYFIAKDGTIYTGRDELQCGAHTEGYNTAGMGICCEGSYQVETMPDAQKEAIVELLKDLRSRYGNLPIKGHKHFNATACSGDKFPLDEIITAVKGVKAQQPAEKVAATEKLAIDGRWGKATTRRAQEVFKTPVDGIISNQLAAYRSRFPGILNSTIEWDNVKKGGSALIRAMQKHIGVKVDGYLGQDTARAWQKYLGTPVDGIFDDPSIWIKAFQKWLNKQ